MGRSAISLRRGGVAAAAALVLGLASGCTDTRGGTIPYNVSLGTPDAAVPTTLPADYKIAPMDTVTVKIYRMDDLTGDYLVDLMGNISMPLIGEVTAAGETPQQLAANLARKYGAKYLRNPDVSVEIKSSAGRIVTVDGAVNKSGAYPVIGPMTLIQAVALAGGTSDDANAHRVAIFRTIDGKREAAAFDLESIRHGQMQDPPIYPGDIVVVDGSKIKETLKELFQGSPLIALFRPII